MKQYGFYIDSSKCTGCKTCQLSCKDNKDLDVGVNYRRVYEYAGGNWVKDGDAWQQDIFSYYLSIACNHCSEPACAKVCPSGAMRNGKMGLWWWIPRPVSVVNTARWPVLTAHRNITPRRAT